MHARIVSSLLAGVFLFGIPGWVFPATAWAAEAARTGESPTAIPLIIHLPGAKADADAAPEAAAVDSPAQVEPAPSASNRAEPDTVNDRDTPPVVAGNESAAADPPASGSTDTTETAAGAPGSADTTEEAPADPQAASGDSASPPESDPAAGAQGDQNPEGASREENTPVPEVETEAPRSPRILLY